MVNNRLNIGERFYLLFQVLMIIRESRQIVLAFVQFKNYMRI